MKKLFFLLSLVLASCVAKPIISDTACNDPEYLRLKKIPIDAMTDREFAFFQTKDRECEEARANSNVVEQLQAHGDKQIISTTACNDSLFLQLKSKSVQLMTSREFSYFQLKDEECEQAHAAANAVTQLKTGSQESTILLLVIDAVLVIVGAAILLHSH